MTIERMFARAFAPVWRQIRLLCARGVIKLVNDGLKEQGVQLQLLSGEVKECERYQHYGFSSVPLSGAEAIGIAIGGDRNHMVVVADGDRRYRKQGLQPGELALYTHEGDTIIMRSGRLVEIDTQTLRVNAAALVEINTDQMTVNAATRCDLATPLVAAAGAIEAQLDISDSVAADAKSMAGMREVYNEHDHDETGSVTGVPNEQM